MLELKFVVLAGKTEWSLQQGHKIKCYPLIHKAGESIESIEIVYIIIPSAQFLLKLL